MLQKIKKYSLQLLALQCIIIIGLLGYSYFQSLQNDHQELAIIENLGEDYQTYGDFVQRETTYICNNILKKVREEMRGEVFLVYMEMVRETTQEYIEEIEKVLKQKEKTGKMRPLAWDVNDYFSNVKEILIELNDSVRNHNPNLISEIFGDYLLIDEVMRQLKNNKTDVYQTAYLKKTKREIRLIENKVVEHLWNRLPNSCGLIYDKYYTHVIAPNRLWQGETLNAAISFTKSASINRPIFMVGDKGIQLDSDGRGHYELKVNELGTHLLEGKVIMRDNWGKERTHTFSHEYTVLPKCN